MGAESIGDDGEGLPVAMGVVENCEPADCEWLAVRWGG